jgi:hypothetical protein
LPPERVKAASSYEVAPCYTSLYTRYFLSLFENM